MLVPTRAGTATAPTPGFVYAVALAVVNSTLAFNSARSGGGLGAENGTTVLQETVVVGNSAYFGGGLFMDFGSGTLTLATSSVASNIATWSGNQIMSFSVGNLGFVNGTVMASPDAPNGRNEIDVTRGGNITVDATSVMLRCSSGNIVQLPVHVDSFPSFVGWWTPCVAGLSALRAFCAACPRNTYALTGGVISPLRTVGTTTIENPVCRECPYGGECEAGGRFVRAMPGFWGNVVVAPVNATSVDVVDSTSVAFASCAVRACTCARVPFCACVCVCVCMCVCAVCVLLFCVSCVTRPPVGAVLLQLGGWLPYVQRVRAQSRGTAVRQV